MAAKRRLNKLTRTEQAFWEKAALGAELSVLWRTGTKLSPTGAAHLMAEFADALLAEHRRRFNSR
jgi:hypothetical protein